MTDHQSFDVDAFLAATNLNSDHRDVVKQLFAVPASENIEWRKVRSLLEALGSVTQERNGKLKVEAKSDMKRRGLRSPDIADALCLTFSGQAAVVGGRASHWIKGKPLVRAIKGVV